MRQKIVAGNWKMNKDYAQGINLVKELHTILETKTPNCRVIVAPPFIHLATLASMMDSKVIGLAAQNVANHSSGAYTGEVSAEMVASTGAQYTIIGHSERRSYYHEDGDILKEKVLLALEAGLLPIFCVGEQLQQREANEHYQVVSKQLSEALFNLTPQQFQKIVVAYEPVWAIGTGKTATPQQANDMHTHIRSEIANKYGAEIANQTSILYGGSCNASNANELFAMSDIDGGLIGGASLECEKFLPIIEAFN